MDKELLYQTLNNILDSMESGHYQGAQTQLKGLINEINHGIYD
jgi:hypothetical protein